MANFGVTDFIILTVIKTSTAIKTYPLEVAAKRSMAHQIGNKYKNQQIIREAYSFKEDDTIRDLFARVGIKTADYSAFKCGFYEDILDLDTALIKNSEYVIIDNSLSLTSGRIGALVDGNTIIPARVIA